MKTKTGSIILLSIGLPVLLLAQQVQTDSDKVKSLLAHSIAFDLRGEDILSTAGKERLKRILTNVKVIGLGEITHEDGATLEAKVKLVQYLHEELGFNVLAFESSFCGGWLANEAIKNGESLWASAKNCPGWNLSEYAYEIFEYARDSHQTDNPLIIAGFDNEKLPTAVSNIQNLVAMCQTWTGYQLSEADAADIDSLIQAVGGAIGNQYAKSITYRARQNARQQIEALLSAIVEQEARLVADHSAEKVKMAQFALRSFLLSEKESVAGAFRNIARDKHMFDRFRWLKEEIYPDEKIIIWAASAHLMRNGIAITRKEAPGSYGFYPYYQMGDYLYEHYRDELYTIAFTTSEGSYGTVYPEGHKWKAYEEVKAVEPPIAQSFEAIAEATNADFLFCDLQHVPATSWLARPFVAYPFGFVEDRAVWSSIVDGIFFIKVMKPDLFKEKE